MLRGFLIFRSPRKFPALASIVAFAAVAFAVLFSNIQLAYSLPLYRFCGLLFQHQEPSRARCALLRQGLPQLIFSRRDI